MTSTEQEREAAFQRGVNAAVRVMRAEIAGEIPRDAEAANDAHASIRAVLAEAKAKGAAEEPAAPPFLVAHPTGTSLLSQRRGRPRHLR